MCLECCVHKYNRGTARTAQLVKVPEFDPCNPHGGRRELTPAKLSSDL